MAKPASRETPQPPSLEVTTYREGRNQPVGILCSKLSGGGFTISWGV